MGRFNPERDIPHLSGKIILVTGGNNGLGKETILQLAKHNPETIYMGARNEAKAKSAIRAIEKAIPKANITFIQLDLVSLTSVKKVAEKFLSENDWLDILVNNADDLSLRPVWSFNAITVTLALYPSPSL